MQLKRILFIAAILCCTVLNAQLNNYYDEPHRPKIHFSPKEKWMNDPNGMVYHNGYYHLFYQYYPDSTVWGPMHWGHAISKDMIRWEHLPVALYPDSLGYIFSGSAVVDFSNSSGLGKNGKAPLVAIFTHHDPKGEKEGKTNYQNQSIAYSMDDGRSWTKYANNPVIKNPGIADFRDPKVMWYEKDKKWMMTLAVKDRIFFYSSPNLRDWTKESEFGKDIGAHGGVWECPDLFSLEHDGKQVWILIVNLNPGGPNKGSATQYFIGDFDGKIFSPIDTATRWLDYGPDEYAGVTWSNTGNRRIFFGWMSNWLYANVVPTEKWRNAMTVPRQLGLVNTGKELLLASQPVKELTALKSNVLVKKKISLSKPFEVADKIKEEKIPCMINLWLEEANDLSIVLSNTAGEQVIIGFDKTQNKYFVDRINSGKTDFQREFAARHFAPRLSTNSKMNMTLVIDISSVELFADDGVTVMTEIFFPNTPFNGISIQSPGITKIKKLQYSRMKNIWK